jgi:hypothetical protein
VCVGTVRRNCVSGYCVGYRVYGGVLCVCVYCVGYCFCVGYCVCGVTVCIERRRVCEYCVSTCVGGTVLGYRVYGEIPLMGYCVGNLCVGVLSGVPSVCRGTVCG